MWMLQIGQSTNRRNCRCTRRLGSGSLIGSPMADSKVFAGNMSPALNFMRLSSALELPVTIPFEMPGQIPLEPPAATATLPVNGVICHYLLFFVASTTYDKRGHGGIQENSLP